MHEKQIGIIGAGVIGLAIARTLAKQGASVTLIERHSSIGTECSSRNSQVVHAGLYYPTNSWKAKLCVPGREMLYEYCRIRKIGFQKCGKLVVATSHDQHTHLNSLYQTARANGVHDVIELNAHEAHKKEPNVFCTAALYSPSTGIVDVHALMESLLGEAEEEGVMVALHTNVVTGERKGNQVWLQCQNKDSMEVDSIPFDYVINSAGLQALPLANAFTPKTKTWDVPTSYSKGTYFKLHAKKSPFRHLIYPVPDCLGGLGLHSTLDMDGTTRFGPNIQWVPTSELSYTVDESLLPDFVERIRRYYPTLMESALYPDYAGIRPKIVSPNEEHLYALYENHDFQFAEASVHGVQGVLHLLGMESPGLTSCLSIAKHVEQIVKSSI